MERRRLGGAEKEQSNARWTQCCEAAVQLSRQCYSRAVVGTTVTRLGTEERDRAGLDEGDAKTEGGATGWGD